MKELITKLVTVTRQLSADDNGIFIENDEISDWYFFEKLIILNEIESDYYVDLWLNLRINSLRIDPLLYDSLLKYILLIIQKKYLSFTGIEDYVIEQDVEIIGYFTHFKEPHVGNFPYTTIIKKRLTSFFSEAIVSYYSDQAYIEHRYLDILWLLSEVYTGIIDLGEFVLEGIITYGGHFVLFYYDFYFMKNNNFQELIEYHFLDDCAKIISKELETIYTKDIEELIFYSYLDENLRDNFREQHTTFQSIIGTTS